MFDTYRRFISSPELLDWYRSGLFAEHTDGSTAYNDLFVLARRERKYLPNYYHELQLDNDLEASDWPLTSDNIRWMLLKSYGEICSTCLMDKNKRIYAKAENFERWQNLLTYFNSIPALAYQALNLGEQWEQAWDILRPALAVSTIPICFSPLLDQMCQSYPWRADISIDQFDDATAPQPGGQQQKSGALYELHMHLNGTSEADVVWLHSLNEPEKVNDYLERAFEKESVRRFYRQFHLKTPQDIYYRLLLARWLQEKISELVIDLYFTSKPQNKPSLSMLDLCQIMALDPSSQKILSDFCDQSTIDEYDNNGMHPARLHPISYLLKRLPLSANVAKFKNQSRTNIQDEGLMMILAFSVLKQENSLLPLLLHCYILLSSQFAQINVQQQSQIGFDQFQHLTEIGLREALEENYDQRFAQLIGMYGPHLRHIEGRFAPKDSLSKITKLIGDIVSSYHKHIGHSINNNTKPDDNISMGQLALVAHFIKEREERLESSCRHQTLREKNERRAKSLVELCSSGITPKVNSFSLKSMIVGKDGAGNELDTPPEVFAPAFRYLNRCGIENTTFHVGEDFRHLLSGLRAVDEAVTFLEMKSGDRIGHGTALGLSPELWKKRLGKGSLCWCYVGEWLDNLVWLCQALKEEGHKEHIASLHLDIERYFHEIYSCGGPKQTTYQTMLEAWSMRSLDARLLNCSEIDDARNGQIGGKNISDIPEKTISSLSFRNDPGDNSELVRLILAVQKKPEAFNLFYLYHSGGDVRRRYNKTITLQVEEIENKLLETAQDYVIKKLNKKDILVEVMPTSNKRISFYDSYAEHHIMNWLKPRTDDSRPVPTVTIASDDPGIFATNLRNEYSHIINTLMTSFAFSRDEAYSAIKCLHKNAEAYAFYSA